MRKTGLSLLTATALLLALAGSAAAQDYPIKPVRLIIPFPPGGSNDVVGRMIATQLGERLGKQVIVDNRGGAGGVLGTEVAAGAAPDGYTILVVSLAYTVNPWLYKLKYDPLKSFVPVAMLASGANVLTVHPSVPVNSLEQLIALAKQKPGELNYASAGAGSFQHLGSELFKLMAGVDIVHVPFKGGGPAMIDVVGGHSQVLVSSLVQTGAHIRSGKLKALGVGSAKRSSLFPDIPTIAEAGVPGYDTSSWFAFFVPARTPPDIIRKMHADIIAVLAEAPIRAKLEQQGLIPIGSTPEELGAHLKSEMEKWAPVIKAAGIRVEQ